MKVLQHAIDRYQRGDLTLEDLGSEVQSLVQRDSTQAPAIGAYIRQVAEHSVLRPDAYHFLLRKLETPATDSDEVTVVRTHTSTARTTTSRHFTTPAAVPPLQPGDADFGIGSVLKGRFVIEAVLGQGAMGVVYKARDLRREEARDKEPYVAIKVLSENFQHHPDAFIALQREAKKAQKLAHPNIVTVYDFDRDGERIFMTMALLEGQPLDKRLAQADGKPFPEDEALAYILQMSRALAYAHEQGIVHSDFKPGNVFITDDGVAKVVDFGIARAAKRPDALPADATVFDAGSLGALTPAYASCEMLDQRDADPADDVYALAVVGYLLLSGFHPFDRLPASSAKALGLEPAHAEKIPAKYRKILFKGLAFEREQRTPDANQFLHEIEQVNAGRKRLWWGLAGGIGIALLILLALVYQTRFGPAMPPPEPVLEDTASLPLEQQARVRRLLDVAKVHAMVGRITEPPGSSAFTAYKQIQELHPNNRQAYAGLKGIADQLQQQARDALQRGEPEAAAALIEKGLEAMPTHAGLLRLKADLPRSE